MSELREKDRHLEIRLYEGFRGSSSSFRLIRLPSTTTKISIFFSPLGGDKMKQTQSAQNVNKIDKIISSDNDERQIVEASTRYTHLHREQ